MKKNEDNNNRIYIPRSLGHACGKWNYNSGDDTYTIDVDGKKMKITALIAEELGWIVKTTW